MEDLYKILGVSKDASQDKIRAAFRRLLRKYHPSFNRGNVQYREKMREIYAAYDILKDDYKRQEYDSSIEMAKPIKKGFFSRKNKIKKITDEYDNKEIFVIKSERHRNINGKPWTLTYLVVLFIFATFWVFLSANHNKTLKTQQTAAKTINEIKESFSVENGKIVYLRGEPSPLLGAMINIDRDLAKRVLEDENYKADMYIDNRAAAVLAISFDWPEIIDLMIRKGFITNKDISFEYNLVAFADDNGKSRIARLLESRGFALKSNEANIGENIKEYEKTFEYYVRRGFLFFESLIRKVITN